MRFPQLLFILCLSLHFLSPAQDTSFFVINPLPIPPALSGSFGELRANHFHAGLDLKTAGKENLNVLAAADGHVSRIKVSPFGYGKALYIDHPEGYTTVYGHLNGYNETIAAYVEAAQIEAKSFEVDIYPGKDELPVVRGEVVALSGNTGGSGGPHLHFEVRETTTEVPRNPLLFGFPLNDRLRPRIQSVAIDPAHASTLIRGTHSSLRGSVNGSRLNVSQPVEISGPFGISVNGYDQFSGSLNQNGFYRLELFVDSTLTTVFTADSIPFHQSRFINAQIDYAWYYRHRSRYLRLYQLPGNQLENVRYPIPQGVVELPAGKHHLTVIASDISGNEHRVEFDVKARDKNAKADASAKRPENLMRWDQHNYYETEHAQVRIPSGALYEDIDFTFKQVLDTNTSKSARIAVHQSATPLHARIGIRLKTYHVNDSSKAFVAQVNSKGRFVRALTSHWNGKWLEADSKYFGYFQVMEDDHAPEIQYPGGGKRFEPGNNKLHFTIKDRMSGIYEYDAYVDGEWIIAEYEPKKNRLSLHTNTIRETNSSHDLRITVRDLVGNVSTFEGTIVK